MGVMSCSRLDCNNIMCNTYVNNIGYICRECQEEFKSYTESNGLVIDTEEDIKRALKEFINTSKDNHIKGKEISIDQFFREYTK